MHKEKSFSKWQEWTKVAKLRDQIREGLEGTQICDMTYMESQNDRKGLIYKTEIETDIENKFMVTKRGKGINWEFGVNRYTPLYIKQTKSYCIAQETIFSIS